MWALLLLRFVKLGALITFFYNVLSRVIAKGGVNKEGSYTSVLVPGRGGGGKGLSTTKEHNRIGYIGPCHRFRIIAQELQVTMYLCNCLHIELVLHYEHVFFVLKTDEKIKSKKQNNMTISARLQIFSAEHK